MHLYIVTNQLLTKTKTNETLSNNTTSDKGRQQGQEGAHTVRYSYTTNTSRYYNESKREFILNNIQAKLYNAKENMQVVSVVLHNLLETKLGMIVYNVFIK